MASATWRAASDGVFVFQPSGALDADAVVGNYVEVTGTVSEFGGLTEITAAAADITDAGSDFDAVEAVTNPWPGTSAQRESLEGMLFQPSGPYTVTNTFGTNQYGEVGLAVGKKPLIQPTEVAAPRFSRGRWRSRPTTPLAPSPSTTARRPTSWATASAPPSVVLAPRPASPTVT